MVTSTTGKGIDESDPVRRIYTIVDEQTMRPMFVVDEHTRMVDDVRGKC
jgi:hypothetical protein